MLAVFIAIAQGISAWGQSCSEQYAALVKNTTFISAVDEVYNGKFKLSAIPGYDPDAVYIGVANNPADGDHHYYLIIGNKRFDSYGVFSRARIHTQKKGGPPLAADGVLFKLSVDQATYDEITKNLAPSRDISCLHAICRVLTASGVELLQDGAPISTKAVTTGLISGKARTTTGASIPIEIVATSEHQLKKFLHEADTADKRYRKQILLALFFRFAGVAGVGAAGAATAFAVLDSN
jgi:hypothetical protein